MERGKYSIGDVVNSFTVISPEEKIKGHYYYRCKCECGNIREVLANDLARGKSKSCGCRNTKVRVGQEYGRLKVERRLKTRSKSGLFLWICKCRCGNKITLDSHQLVTMKYPSCGCINGLVDKSGYRSWASMIQRCYNKNDPAYSYYGGRGISVCERWRKGYVYFLEDMGERPDKHTLDRIDNNGNYQPDNCRWAKIEEQSWNKRHTVKLEYNGEQITLRDLCLKTGLKRSLLYARIVILGWDIEKAITTPVKNNKNKVRYGK